MTKQQACPDGFADLFESQYVPYAEADIVGTLAALSWHSSIGFMWLLRPDRVESSFASQRKGGDFFPVAVSNRVKSSAPPSIAN